MGAQDPQTALEPPPPGGKHGKSLLMAGASFPDSKLWSHCVDTQPQGWRTQRTSEGSEGGGVCLGDKPEPSLLALQGTSSAFPPNPEGLTHHARTQAHPGPVKTRLCQTPPTHRGMIRLCRSLPTHQEVSDYAPQN